MFFRTYKNLNRFWEINPLSAQCLDSKNSTTLTWGADASAHIATCIPTIHAPKYIQFQWFSLMYAWLFEGVC